MRYEYECTNSKCGTKNRPHEFEDDVSMANRHTMPHCPKCKKNTWVKKVIRTAFPRSQSWRA